MNPLRTFWGRTIAIATAALALIAVPLGAAPAFADQQQLVAKYVALGDSYAAGQGAGSYLDACLRSPLGYASLIGATPRYNLLREPACSGATIADVMTTQLPQINLGTTLVTVTAGADDLGIAQVFSACVPDPAAPACQTAIDTAAAMIPTIGPKMAGLIGAIHARSPRAAIVVTGYPLPFAEAYAAVLPAAAAVDTASAALNAQLAGAVQAQSMAGVPVAFAGVDFGIHEIGGTGTPWLGFDPIDPVDFLHPTADGYVAYENAVLAALR